MIQDINLLPQETKPKGRYLKISNTLRRIAIFGFILFLIASVFSGAVFFVISGRNNDLVEEQDSLKNQIQALEETEQRLVLIQDRLGKINTISGLPSSDEELSATRDILNRTGSGVIFQEAEISEESMSISVITQNSSSMARFLAELVANQYERIELASFFVGEDGYSMSIDLII